jgi:hypothetical protein
MTLNPYQAMRLWNRKKEEFPDIKGSEELFSHTFMCVEEQVAYMSKKYSSIYDDEVSVAYAICGLRVIGILDAEQRWEFVNIAPEVLEMTDRCMATFHPEDYARIVQDEEKKAWDGLWKTHEDRVSHYRSVGSALRRLTDSRKFWSKRQGLKGYINYVSAFLEENILSDPLGTIHYTFMVQISSPES